MCSHLSLGVHWRIFFLFIRALLSLCTLKIHCVVLHLYLCVISSQPISSKDDTERIKKLLDKPVKNVKDVKPSTLWWANDSDDDSIKKGKFNYFISSKS